MVGIFFIQEFDWLLVTVVGANIGIRQFLEPAPSLGIDVKSQRDPDLGKSTPNSCTTFEPVHSMNQLCDNALGSVIQNHILVEQWDGR
jgi:hypothetical protein